MSFFKIKQLLLFCDRQSNNFLDKLGHWINGFSFISPDNVKVRKKVADEDRSTKKFRYYRSVDSGTYKRGMVRGRLSSWVLTAGVWVRASIPATRACSRFSYIGSSHWTRLTKFLKDQKIDLPGKNSETTVGKADYVCECDLFPEVKPGWDQQHWPATRGHGTGSCDLDQTI